MTRLITAFLAACLCASIAQADVPPPPKAESAVLIRVSDGTGSGVHIGNGIVVTAAHVVEGQSGAMIEMSDDTKVSGKVIFVDARFDIAFIDTKLSGIQIDTAKLACRKAVLGEEVMARGNPGGLRFLSTWGRVAGVVRSVGSWREALPVNLTSGPGYSGAPIFDRDGDVIAILVGGTIAGGLAVVTLSVPSLAVCHARDYLGLK